MWRCKAVSPEITGFYSSRPNLMADPNTGSHTADQWVSRSAFPRLDPVTQAGQFGSEGRNAVRGPGISNIDLSLLKTFDWPSARACSFAPSVSTLPTMPISDCRKRRGFAKFRSCAAGRGSAAGAVRHQTDLLIL